MFVLFIFPLERSILLQQEKKHLLAAARGSDEVLMKPSAYLKSFFSVFFYTISVDFFHWVKIYYQRFDWLDSSMYKRENLISYIETIKGNICHNFLFLSIVLLLLDYTLYNTFSWLSKIFLWRSIILSFIQCITKEIIERSE